ncbi:MAG: thiaminase II [Candidatus Rhabdochlamydia sp.]
MNKLSEQAWEQCLPIIQAIKEHPFNIELANGLLDQEKFGYYIEQDSLYLQDFARSLATLAARAPLQFASDFLIFSQWALIAEQEVVHLFFREMLGLQETGKLTPATFSYTNYLLQVSSRDEVAVGMAAVLPCFWVYRSVGQSIAMQTQPFANNPYLRWIETYASQAFSETVTKAINIFDEMAFAASEKTRQAMLTAFYKSTLLEWHFWNDAYHQTVLGVLK